MFTALSLLLAAACLLPGSAKLLGHQRIQPLQARRRFDRSENQVFKR